MRRTNAFQGQIFGPGLCAALSLSLLACVPVSPVATQPSVQPSHAAPSAPAPTQSTPISTPTLRQPSTAGPAPSLTRPQPELPATALGEDCSRSRRLFARAAHRHFPDVPLALLSCAKPAITTDLAFLVSHGYYAFESFYSSSTITGSTPPPLTPAGGDWYRDERIALPATQLVGRSEDEIAVALMEQYLTHFASPDADSANRLLEYRDVAVLDVNAQALGALARENDATFARGLTYSVRPFALELNVWIAGNGDIDNASGWVTSKTLFVAITLSGDDYVFEPLGTGQGDMRLSEILSAALIGLVTACSGAASGKSGTR